MKPRHRIQRHQHRREDEKNQQMTHGHLQPKPFKAAQREEAPAGTSRNTFSFANMSVVQPKLTIGEPDNEFEKEADHVASEVVQRINGGQDDLQRSANEEEEEDKVQRSPISSVMRKSARRSDGIVSGAATDEFESQLNQSRGGGSPLEPKLRGQLESAMDADFSQVRIHTGSQSDQLNRSIQAKAFTTGQDVFFKQGEYNPGSRSGQELITHELTHVVQQTGATVQRQPLESVIQREDSSIYDVSGEVIKAERRKRLEFVLKHQLEVHINEDAYKAILKVLGQEFATENPMFIRAVGLLKPDDVYKKYIPDSAEVGQVNLTSKVRAAIINKHNDPNQNLVRTDFTKAIDEILFMERTPMMRLLGDEKNSTYLTTISDAVGYKA